MRITAMNAIIGKTSFTLFIILCSVITLRGQSKQFSIEASGIANVTNFEWSIAGNLQGQSPNVLSELNFRKIISVGFYLNGTYNPIKSIELSAAFQKNAVIRGSGMDVDYKDDNRSDITYQEPFNSDKGTIENFMVGGTFDLLSDTRFKLNTGLFYAAAIKSLVILNSDFENLNSGYRAKWKSVNIGVGGTYYFDHRFSFVGSLFYGLNKYNSKSDWNLIQIFKHPVSFEQHANGHEFKGKVSLNYNVSSNLSLCLSGNTGRRKSYKGIDTSYLQNGNEISTQFNGANDNFYELKIGSIVTF